MAAHAHRPSVVAQASSLAPAPSTLPTSVQLHSLLPELSKAQAAALRRRNPDLDETHQQPRTIHQAVQPLNQDEEMTPLPPLPRRNAQRGVHHIIHDRPDYYQIPEALRDPKTNRKVKQRAVFAMATPGMPLEEPMDWSATEERPNVKSIQRQFGALSLRPKKGAAVDQMAIPYQWGFEPNFGRPLGPFQNYNGVVDSLHAPGYFGIDENGIVRQYAHPGFMQRGVAMAPLQFSGSTTQHLGAPPVIPHPGPASGAQLPQFRTTADGAPGGVNRTGLPPMTSQFAQPTGPTVTAPGMSYAQFVQAFAQGSSV